MKSYTENERYELAKNLHDVVYALLTATARADMDFNEDWLDALEDAVQLISPQYVTDYERELEDALNSPEIKAQEEEYLQTPQAQAFIADIEKHKRGEITLDELREKWRRDRQN